MAMVFITYRDNWADEMDISGFNLMSRCDWNLLLEETRLFFKKRYSYTFRFGTNEEIEYGSFGEWFRCFRAVDVTDDQAPVLTTVFQSALLSHPNGRYEFGFFPLPSLSGYDDDDDWYEDEDADPVL